MPNFEVLDAKIASALNRIIHNTQFKRKFSMEEQKAQKENRFFRGRQIAYLIYESLEPTILSRIMQTYLQLFFEMMIFRNSIRNGTNSIMTKIPSDDILEGLYKLRMRESEKLKTVLDLYDLEMHQKKVRTWLITDWRQWWKEVSSRIYESRISRPETEIMKGTPWPSIRGQNSVDKGL